LLVGTGDCGGACKCKHESGDDDSHGSFRFSHDEEELARGAKSHASHDARRHAAAAGLLYTYVVDDRPLAKPDHLQAHGDWLARHAAGAIALAIGAITFVAVVVAQDRLFADPDWRIAVPGFAATAVAAAISLARRERAYTLWPIGVGLAASAMLLGYVVMFSIVVGATALLVYILHHVL
jgi:hypothetical protein